MVVQLSRAFPTEEMPGAGIMTFLFTDDIPGAAGIVWGASTTFVGIWLTTWLSCGLVNTGAVEGSFRGKAAAGTVAEQIAVALRAIARKVEVRNMTVSCV
ncbi:hypothetical protein XI06_30550 [Bradyrhizobium sp. CCBAU 11434]|nr:hypothetical protein [Bradyrhizobium sp. CCBAU 11434]